MKEKVRFTKMHGCGNDYIYVNTLLYSIADPSSAAVAWSRQHYAVGSDGLILIGRGTAGADFTMRIFNADGSEAMMCGNGARCVAKYLHDKGLTTKNPIRLHTLSGIKTLHLNLGPHGETDTVAVDMGQARLEDKEQYNPDEELPLAAIRQAIPNSSFLIPNSAGTFVSMGNPHYVVFLPAEVDIEAFDLTGAGSALERAACFPQRCNIEFAQVLADGTLRTRVWERGSGITLACGTGACATAVAAYRTGRATTHATVQMDGGTLTIDIDPDTLGVRLTGPAAIAYEGEIELP